MNHRVKLTREQGAQVVRMPRDMELPGEEAIIRRDGRKVILEPGKATDNQAIVAWLKTIEAWDGEWPVIDDRAPDDVLI